MNNYKPEEYLGIVHKVVLRMCKKNGNLYAKKDDMEGDGFLALVEACAKYKPGPVDFPMYATVHVHNRIVDAIRKDFNHFGVLEYLEDMTLESEDDGEELSWEDTIPGSVVDVKQVIDKMPTDLKYYYLIYDEYPQARDFVEIVGCSNRKFYEFKQELTDYLEEGIKVG